MRYSIVFKCDNVSFNEIRGRKMKEDTKALIRAPICAVLGHVDHGKTALLDKIRGTAVQKREAGGITQHIGASFIPTPVIFEIIKPIVEAGIVKIDRSKWRVPGLLFIDTPGHETFRNLRARGSSIADLGILVVDVTAGFQPQTYESIDLFRSYKVPFVVAANKIDKLPGWNPQPDMPFLLSMKKQPKPALDALDRAIDRMIINLADIGISAERFDRVRDFARQIPIVPTSAITGEGIPELLLVLVGVAQRFLGKKLKLTLSPEAKGVILEVRRVEGIGTVIDAIIYDGILTSNSYIVYISRHGPEVRKIRALLMPKPLEEIRDPRERFLEVDKVTAAAGVRIVASDLDDALAGSPLYGIPADLSEQEVQVKIEHFKRLAIADIAHIRFKKAIAGVVVKADTLGSLEAIIAKLDEMRIPVSSADVGPVDKEDVFLAATIRQEKEEYGVILAFNVDIMDEAKELAEKEEVKIIRSNIIYELFDQLRQHIYEVEEKRKMEILANIPWPGKIQILPGYVFRVSKPAIVGVRVLAGKIRPKQELIREDGRVVGKILQIQSEGKSLQEAVEGMDVAISIDKAVVGRHIKEGMILYVHLRESEVKETRKYMNLLPSSTREALREYINIMRKVTKKPWWGL